MVELGRGTRGWREGNLGYGIAGCIGIKGDCGRAVRVDTIRARVTCLSSSGIIRQKFLALRGKLEVSKHDLKPL